MRSGDAGVCGKGTLSAAKGFDRLLEFWSGHGANIFVEIGVANTSNFCVNSALISPTQRSETQKTKDFRQ
jgi:hypothetical protein